MLKNKCKDCGNMCDCRAIRCRSCNDKIPKRTGPRSQATKDKIAKSLLGNIPWNKGTGVVKVTRSSEALSAYRRARMLGDKNPAKRPDVKAKIRRSLLRTYEKNPAIKDRIRLSLLRTYKEKPEILENRKSSGINQHSKTYTSIERRIAEVLLARGLSFLHNFKVGRYYVDFILMDDVVIECDGEYWHEAKDKTKEDKRERFLHDKGYYTFHFAGRRILSNPEECVSTLLNVMEGLRSCRFAGGLPMQGSTIQT